MHQHNLPIRPGYRQRWLGNPLLRHDLAIVSALLRDLLRRWRDAFAIVGMAIFGVAVIRNLFLDLSEQTHNLAFFAFMSFIATICDLFLRSRTRYFRRDSALAATALVDFNSLNYRMTGHLLMSSLTTSLLCLPDVQLFLEALASWWMSLVPVAVAATIWGAGRRIGLERYFGWLLPVWRSRRTGGGVLWATGVTSFLIAVAPYWLSSGAVPFQAAGLTLFVLSWYSPVDHAIVNFERVAGWKPGASVRAVLYRPVKLGLILVAAALVSRDFRSVAAVLTMAFATLTYRFLTIMLSRIVRPQQVDFAMFVLLGLTLSFALPMPFLAPLPIVAMLIWLHRNAAKRLWQLQ